MGRLIDGLSKKWRNMYTPSGFDVVLHDCGCDRRDRDGKENDMYVENTQREQRRKWDNILGSLGGLQ